jgi:hypothetical protein
VSGFLFHHHDMDVVNADPSPFLFATTDTNSVAYCSAPFALLVSDLRLHFYPGNKTLEFDLTAASVQNDLNVSIALNINAYGLGLINADINLCDILGGILCPLPQYEFSGE